MSTLKVNTLEEATAGGATFFTAKAWVNLNGTGTVAIRAGGNVSSITDNGTGDYNINFATNLSNTNYAFIGQSGDYVSSTPRFFFQEKNASSRSVSSVRGVTGYANTGNAGIQDNAYIYAMITGS